MALDEPKDNDKVFDNDSIKFVVEVVGNVLGKLANKEKLTVK